MDQGILRDRGANRDQKEVQNYWDEHVSFHRSVPADAASMSNVATRFSMAFAPNEAARPLAGAVRFGTSDLLGP
jgi:hypothetical protein